MPQVIFTQGYHIRHESGESALTSTLLADQSVSEYTGVEWTAPTPKRSDAAVSNGGTPAAPDLREPCPSVLQSRQNEDRHRNDAANQSQSPVTTVDRCVIPRPERLPDGCNTKDWQMACHLVSVGETSFKSQKMVELTELVRQHSSQCYEQTGMFDSEISSRMPPAYSKPDRFEAADSLQASCKSDLNFMYATTACNEIDALFARVEPTGPPPTPFAPSAHSFEAISPSSADPSITFPIFRNQRIFQGLKWLTNLTFF